MENQNLLLSPMSRKKVHLLDHLSQFPLHRDRGVTWCSSVAPLNAQEAWLPRLANILRAAGKIWRAQAMCSRVCCQRVGYRQGKLLCVCHLHRALLPGTIASSPVKCASPTGLVHKQVVAGGDSIELRAGLKNSLILLLYQKHSSGNSSVISRWTGYYKRCYRGSLWLRRSLKPS